MSEPKVQLVDPQGNMNLPGMNATGVITASSFSGEGGVVTGLTGSPNLNVGVVTATSFVGDGTGHAANLTGTPNLNLGLTTATSFVGDAVGKAAGLTGTPNLNVGLVTATSFAGNVTGDVTGNITGLAASVTPGVNLNVGVCTAIQYHGNGANLTGAGSSAYIAQEVTASGAETIIDLSDGNLIYFDQTYPQTTVGFASTSPAEQITFIRNTGRSFTSPTGGVDFDGSGDYILAPVSADFKMTGDFTMECWFKPDSVSGVHVILNGRGSASSGGPVIYTNGTTLVFDNGTGPVCSESSAVVAGTWYHVAGTRSGNTWKLYKNGTEVADGTDSTSYSSNVGFMIGQSYHGNEEFDGIISNARVVKGSVVYTSNFTRPSSPLTNISGTVLLCCQSASSTTTAAVTPGVITESGNPTATVVGAPVALPFNIIWPNTVKWNTNVTPTLINNRRSAAFQIFHLTTGDTGASYQAWEESKDNPLGGPYTLWSWGNNDDGMLGQNNITDYSSPVQIPGTTWDSMTVGGSSGSSTSISWVAIKTDGTLWSWGDNDEGELGVNDTNDRSSPTQIGTDTDWSRCEGDDEHKVAIKTDGTLWIWGWNSAGQLGLNQTADWGGGAMIRKSSPTQIPGSWSKSTCGYRQTMATKTDGSLWIWGANGEGSLGINMGPTTRLSSPTQIGTDTDWSDPICGRDVNAAIKTNGTLWMWGRGHDGATGQNNRTDRSSPTQVPGTWTAISIGTQPYVLAVKTDGTLWSWGNGKRGQLGQNVGSSNLLLSSPTQIPGTTWNQAVAAEFQSQATKTDGTMWAWGDNTNSGTYGALGLNDLTQRSSPTQIGTGTDWGVASGGGGFGMAFKHVSS